MRRAGSGAWAGLCNTHFWVDRTSGIAASIYSNFLPFVPPEALQLYADFERALYAVAVSPARGRTSGSVDVTADGSR